MKNQQDFLYWTYPGRGGEEQAEYFLIPQTDQTSALQKVVNYNRGKDREGWTILPLPYKVL